MEYLHLISLKTVRQKMMKTLQTAPCDELYIKNHGDVTLKY